MQYARITYSIVALGAGLWCALILLAPLCAASGSASVVPVAGVLYAFFRPLCHQMASRSFFLSGEPMAVCARCSSVYFSFFLGTLAYPFLRDIRSPRPGGLLLLSSACAPMVLDITLCAAGVCESTNLTRALTGGWFGLIMPYLVIPGAVEGIDQMFPIRHRRPNPVKGLTDE